jgi:SAM-dependent methyltransferase
MRKFLEKLLGRRAAGEAKSNENDDVADLAELFGDMEWLCPPNTVHDPHAWDAYWKNQVTHGLGPEIFDMFLDSDEMVGVLRANGLRSVLCVGNGISQEPRMLAKAGFDVAAMDLSPVAMYLCTRICEEGGPIPRFVVGDLIDPAICPGPFDVVIERRTLQLFPDSERPLALQAVANRLAQRGIFFSHCHDSGWRPPADPYHATESWFHENGWDVWRHDTESLKGRAAWPFMSTG